MIRRSSHFEHDRSRTGTAVGTLARLLVIAGLAALAPASFAAPDLTGSWVLDADPDASDDVEDAFKGKLRKERFPTPLGNGELGGPDSPRDATQREYWEMVRKRKESKSMKDLQRLGTAYPLITAKRFDITSAVDGYTVVYDSELPRQVKPNPEGRIFTASGEELVVDTLGHSLSYWDKDTLVIENDTPRGGKVVEKFRVSDAPRRLHHSVSVRMGILKEPVTLERVFDVDGVRK